MRLRWPWLGAQSWGKQAPQPHSAQSPLPSAQGSPAQSPVPPERETHGTPSLTPAGYMSRLPPPPEPAQLAAVVKAIKGSKKPVVYLGGGTLDAAPEVGLGRRGPPPGVAPECGARGLRSPVARGRSAAGPRALLGRAGKSQTDPKKAPTPNTLANPAPKTQTRTLKRPRPQTPTLPPAARVCAAHQHPRGQHAHGAGHLPRRGPPGAADAGDARHRVCQLRGRPGGAGGGRVACGALGGCCLRCIRDHTAKRSTAKQNDRKHNRKHSRKRKH